NRLAASLRVVETGDGRPTCNVRPIFDDIKVELKTQTDKLQQALTLYLPRFNQIAQKLGLQSVAGIIVTLFAVLGGVWVTMYFGLLPLGADSTPGLVELTLAHTALRPSDCRQRSGRARWRWPASS